MKLNINMTKNNTNKSPVQNCRSAPRKRQNSSAKGRTLKFEGHMMPNKDEYQKYVQF